MVEVRRSDRRPALAAYASLVAFSAYAGAVGLATGALDVGHQLNRRLPLHSPALGAIALALLVGTPTTVLACQAGRGDERTGVTAAFAGILLIAWIFVELAFIREFSALQPFYVGVGISFIVIGRRLDGHRPRRRYRHCIGLPEPSASGPGSDDVAWSRRSG